MSYSNSTKPTSTWSNTTKPTLVDTFLLKEDTFYLLLETGDKIVLTDADSAWGQGTKPTSSWTNTTKP